jgi:hypothetical protein
MARHSEKHVKSLAARKHDIRVFFCSTRAISIYYTGLGLYHSCGSLICTKWPGTQVRTLYAIVRPTTFDILWISAFEGLVDFRSADDGPVKMCR